MQASGSNALPLRCLSLIQPDLVIQTAWCQQGVVSDQLGVRGDQQLLALIHVQVPADGCLDEASDHTIGLDEVFIPSQHVEIAGGKTTGLTRDPRDFLLKSFITHDFLDILKILYTKFLDDAGKSVSGFRFQDAVAGGGALFVLANLFRHLLKGDVLMKLDK